MAHRHHPTPASRLAAVATVVLALLLVPRMLAEPPLAILLLEGVGLVVGLVAGVAMWFTNSFEARLFASILAAAAFGIALLSVTIGLPGMADTEQLNVGRGLLLVACVGVGCLILADARVRRAQRESARRPYAL